MTSCYKCLLGKEFNVRRPLGLPLYATRHLGYASRYAYKPFDVEYWDLCM
jgi:hypothetical protein